MSDRRETIREKLGLVHVYTGDGKGKTTAALGLAMRAIGNGLNVAMVQFMKSPEQYGEWEMSDHIDNFLMLPMGRSCLVEPGKPEKDDVEAAEAALRKAEEILCSGKYDLVILDEVNVASAWKLIRKEDVVSLVKGRPPNVEIVLTGRYAPEEFIDLADLVTEMRLVKHPFQRGIPARAGIER